MEIKLYMRLDLYANINTKEILAAIGIEEDCIPRLRGVGIDDGKILIHTRTGGGNREQYDTVEARISGEYGLDNDIQELKTPGSWSFGYHEEKGDRLQAIADLEEFRATV